ncbi:MAG: hypothetical protein ACR2P3_05705, partial [Geminicoccaceae bacterium]
MLTQGGATTAGNSASIVQTVMGTFSTINASQTGNRNQTDIMQMASNSGIMLTQDGNRNNAIITQ